MSVAFTQVYVQFILAVGNKDCIIGKEWEDSLNKQIASFLRKNGHTPIIIKGSHDHVHIFTVLDPKISIESAAEQIKLDAAQFVNNSGFQKKTFIWQKGYGAFTYSKTRTNDVYLYIQQQDRYHAKRSFREEFIEFLRLSGVEYDPNDLPKGYEEFTMVMDR
jgi:putative transposase